MSTSISARFLSEFQSFNVPTEELDLSQLLVIWVTLFITNTITTHRKNVFDFGETVTICTAFDSRQLGKDVSRTVFVLGAISPK